MSEQDAQFMQLALAQAKKAYLAGEVPVGAVVVKDGQVIA
ncbi:MAG: tRNA-specific adenosine deaminase, partial [Betaproteobacteria bacterium]|nr:tRNA-specific adenosine deaminase [Betaproteobacteria bacterium]